MIGNDIVDLNAVSSGSKFRRKRFIDKIFSYEEQELISKSTDYFQTIWLLWSMKESAYKSYVRQHSKRFFRPRKIECRLISKRDGLINISKEVYKTYSTVNKNYIYTVALSNSSSKVISKCIKVEVATYANQHKESYKNILSTFSKLENVPLESLAIKKNELGIPKMYKNNLEQSILFSITHHGNYMAYAILNNE